MALLVAPPSQDDLARLYWELAQRGAPAGGAKRAWPYRPDSPEELVALAAEMSRYDPRLVTILTAWIATTWAELNPLQLRAEMRRMEAPQAMCVILSFVRLGSSDVELRRLIDYVCAGWPVRSPPERFFYDAERPHTKLAAARLGQSLIEYSRWGFIGLERPQIDVFRKRSVGTYDARTRREILRRMATRRGELALSDYLAEIDHSIGRQQAIRDARAAGLLQRGHKRGSRWVLPVAGMVVRLGPGEIRVRGAGGVETIRLDHAVTATIASEPTDDRWVDVDVHTTDPATRRAVLLDDIAEAVGSPTRA